MTEGARVHAGGGGTGTGMGVALVPPGVQGPRQGCVSIQNDGDLLIYPGLALDRRAHMTFPCWFDVQQSVLLSGRRAPRTAITTMRERSLDHVGVGVSLEAPPPISPCWPRAFNPLGEGPILDLKTSAPPGEGTQGSAGGRTARPH